MFTSDGTFFASVGYFSLEFVKKYIYIYIEREREQNRFAKGFIPFLKDIERRA